MEPTATRAATRAITQFSADAADNRVAERALALVRVLLSVAALVTARFSPADASGVAGILLFVYAVMAVLFLLVLFVTTFSHLRLPLAAHIVDLLFAGALILVPTGLRAPYFGLV